MQKMQKYILIFAIFVCALFFVGCTATAREEGNGTYVIKYSDGNSQPVTFVAKKTGNGTYELENGSVVGIVPTQKVEVVGEVTKDTSSTTARPVCECKCNCCPGSEKPCVEPDPLERYLCSDNSIVKNKGDCSGTGTCDYRAVGKLFYCADGKETDNPENCGVVVETLYVCSNGQTVSSEAECTCTTVTVAQVQCDVHVVEKKFRCSDGSVTTSSTGCGRGDVKMVYLCSDGRKVEKEADCSGPCQKPTYTAYSIAASMPSNAVRLVY